MADETPEIEPTTAPEAAAEPAAPKLSGKAERARRDHLAKSQRGPRTTAERDAERRELRKAKAAARTRRRAQEKAKRASGASASGASASGASTSGASNRGTGTPPAPPKDSSPQMRTGTVVSAKPDKTIVVRIDLARRHRKYEKIVRSTSKLHAHDETNDAHEGDLVRVSESRPLSRTKRWKLEEVLERAK
jgi:small subunit ribosomal protein S17